MKPFPKVKDLFARIRAAGCKLAKAFEASLCLLSRQRTPDHILRNLLRGVGVELVTFLKLTLLSGHPGLDARHHEMAGRDDVRLDVAGSFKGEPVHDPDICAALTALNVEHRFGFFWSPLDKTHSHQLLAI
jgi:hypothetical protein